MLRIKEVVGTVATAAFFLLPSVIRADTTPVPTLVYNFTYSANQDINAKDSSNPAEDYGSPDSKTGGNAYAKYGLGYVPLQHCAER